MKNIILSLLLLGVLFGQVNDKSFKEKISDGVIVVVFTSKWAESDGMEYVKGISGHEEAVIIKAMSEETKKICKKLRLRNFPSIVLFHDGKKKEAWKADMDGENDVSNLDIKKAISDAMSGDVY